MVLSNCSLDAVRVYPTYGKPFDMTFERAKTMVEAGGVEPPSEKRYGPKPTCLAQFGCFRLPRLERARNVDG